MANGATWRHSAAIGEYDSRFLNGQRRSVNRKVQGSSPCPGAKLQFGASKQRFTTVPRTATLTATVHQHYGPELTVGSLRLIPMSSSGGLDAGHEMFWHRPTGGGKRSPQAIVLGGFGFN